MTIYNKKDVEIETLKYFNGDELAVQAWISKYALQNQKGEYEELTPDDTHRRLASEFARIEKNYLNPLPEETIYNLFKNFKYLIPQGSPMEGIGNNHRVQSLSNCFVIAGAKDSYGGIFKTDQEQAQLMKRRGGVGHDLSNIRPKGVITNNAAKTSDGILGFMERYSNTTREVAQNGRRGALMLTISSKHYEVETFINSKKDLLKVTGANISVKIDDELMMAVKNDDLYTIQWPVDSINPAISKQIKARDLWNKIIDGAWSSAEPGVLFWDTALKYTPSDIYKDFGFGSVACNPCGEIVLSPYDSCRLLVLNLLSYVDMPYTSSSVFNISLFKDHVIIAQRLMDDLIDLEIEKIDAILAKISLDPEDEDVKQVEKNLWLKIKESAINGRRTGLGITALGDMLAALGIKYGSEDSIWTTEQIYKTLAIYSEKSSIILAKERGAFPIHDFQLEKDHPFLNRVWNELPGLKEDAKHYGRRNIAKTTTAPAGTTSMMTQTTSGIESTFMLEYKRRKKIMGDSNIKPDFIDKSGDKWQEFIVHHHGLKQWMDVTGETDIKKSPYWGATANEIDHIQSVRIQAAAQKWLEHSISKTCNLPNTATKELVSDLYMMAWESGCKGFTIYREGSRSGVLVSNETTKKDEDFVEHDAPKRPKELKADYHVVTANGIKYAVIIGLWGDTNKPYEIFAFENPPMDKNTKGRIVKIKKGHYKFINGEFEIEDVQLAADRVEQRSHTILMSMLLRTGAKIEHINNVAKKIDDNISSFSSACRRVLSKYEEKQMVNGEVCPDCGANLIREEGCIHCENCTFSKCG